MRRQAIAILLGLAAIAAIVASCGGSGDSGGGASSASTGSTSTASNASDTSSSTTAATPLTKAEFVKQGDAICKKVPSEYSAKLQALEKTAKSKPSVEEVNLKAAVPPLRVATEELEELGVPSGDEAQIEVIVAALKEAADGLEAKPESPLSGPKSPFAKFQKLTGEYGFKVCTQL
jgi:hypothetical protein